MRTTMGRRDAEKCRSVFGPLRLAASGSVGRLLWAFILSLRIGRRGVAHHPHIP
jgi:hypothetical protein